MSLLTRFEANVAAIAALKDGASDIETMRRYSGWGGFSSFFEDETQAHRIEELKELVTQAEYESLYMGVLDAFYTPEPIARIVAQVFLDSGLTNAHRVLDPAIGLMGMVSPLQGQAKIVGLEKDLITAQIVKAINANDSSVEIRNTGFEKVLEPSGTFDAAIFNPPYGEQRVFDPMSASLSKHPIHQFFILKAMDLLAEGGVMAVLVSASFMDSEGEKAKEARWAVSKEMDLLAGYRLPSSTFADTNTAVVTDLLFLRKRTALEKAESFVSLSPINNLTIYQGTGVAVNKYFADNTDHVLGKIDVSYGRYGSRTLSVKGSFEDAISRLDALVEPFIFSPTLTTEEDDGLICGTDLSIDKESQPELFEYHLVESKGLYVQRIVGDRYAVMPSIKPKGNKERRLLAGLDLAQKLATVQDYEKQHHVDAVALETAREELNKDYDLFVKRFGAVNNSANTFLMDDNRLLPLFGLETNYQKRISEKQAEKQNCDPCEESWNKAAILFERVYYPMELNNYAFSPKQALTLSAVKRGSVDLSYMEECSPFSKAQLIEALVGDSIFFDPDLGKYVLRDEYLSGNIRKKLDSAEKHNLIYGLQKNIDALNEVKPVDIKPHELDVPFLASWVPEKFVEEFAEHITGASQKVNAMFGGFVGTIEDCTTAKSEQFGTTDVSCAKLLHALLNKQPIKVTKDKGEGKTLDQAATIAAQTKADVIKREWDNWIKEDVNRLDLLAAIFNARINSYSVKEYNGEHLCVSPGVFEGQSSTFVFRQHQINAVWTNICLRGGLNAHVVGSGKSSLAAATAYLGVEMGIFRSPIITAPSNTLGHWVSEFKQIFPNANVLLIDDSSKGSDSATRRRLLARIALRNWHGVVMSHETFTSIDAPDDGLYEVMSELKAEAHSTVDIEDQVDKKTARMIARRRQSIENKAEANLEKARRLRGYGFERLETNYLVVDEADCFKNLQYFTCHYGVKGLGNPIGSGKCTDLLAKIRHVNAKHDQGCKGVNFLTGTPLSNGIGEVYNLAKYLRQDALVEMGFDCFDGFISAFATPSSEFEITATGEFKPQSRFRAFTNVIELNAFFKSFTDVVSKNDLIKYYENLGNVWPEPKLKGGKTIDCVVESNPEFQAYNDYLIERSEALANGDSKDIDPSLENDNMLAIIGASANAALDMRITKDLDIAGITLDMDYQSPKINAMAENMIDVYYRVKHDQKGTQLGFVDLGTPKNHSSMPAVSLPEFSVYHHIKEKLIAGGIPDSVIAFVHDATTPKQRSKLFEQVRNGEVRILLSSTQKAGAGTNIQDRLVALHSLTIPWRPRDLIQQIGRIQRQGNLFFIETLQQYEQGLIEKADLFEVEVYRYALSMSLDALKIQTLEAKARLIETFLSKENFTQKRISARDADDIDFSEFKARTSGNPALLLKYKNDRVLRQLFALLDDHNRKHSNVYYMQKVLPIRISSVKFEIKQLEECHKARTALEQLNINRKALKVNHLRKGANANKFKTISGIIGNVAQNINESFSCYAGFEGVILSNATVKIKASCTAAGSLHNLIFVMADGEEISFNDLDVVDFTPKSSSEWKAAINKLFKAAENLTKARNRLKQLQSDIGYYQHKKVSVFPYEQEIESTKKLDTILNLAVSENLTVVDGVEINTLQVLDIEELLSNSSAAENSNIGEAKKIIPATAYATIDSPQEIDLALDNTKTTEDEKQDDLDSFELLASNDGLFFESTVDSRGQMGFGF